MRNSYLIVVLDIFQSLPTSCEHALLHRKERFSLDLLLVLELQFEVVEKNALIQVSNGGLLESVVYQLVHFHKSLSEYAL